MSCCCDTYTVTRQFDAEFSRIATVIRRGTFTRMKQKLHIGQVIGENLRRVRNAHGDSQPEAAERLALVGLDWKRDQVASLENGRRGFVSVDELVLFSLAYGVPLTEWVEGDGEVVVSESHTLPRSTLRQALSGAVPESPSVVSVDFSDTEDLSADERVAQTLGVSQADVTRAARELWGHSLTAERDSRLVEHKGRPASELRTLRGGVTRALTRKIKAQLNKEK